MASFAPDCEKSKPKKTKPSFKLSDVPLTALLENKPLEKDAPIGADPNSLSKSVISSVMKNVGQTLQAEGVSEDVIQRLQMLWTNKVEDKGREQADKEIDEIKQEVAESKASTESVVTGGARKKVLLTKKAEPKKKKRSKKSAKKARLVLSQVDGPQDDSSDDEMDPDDDDDDDGDDDDDDDDDNIDGDDDGDGEDDGVEEEPLGSGDDISDEDPADLFDTENVVVCQYDKITRARNKWKFHLKDGIMNLNGKDYVFQKANGDAEW